MREFRTLPATLSRRGYQTALIGKYHMGQPGAPMPGFDRWLAFSLGHTRSFYDNVVIDEGREYPGVYRERYGPQWSPVAETEPTFSE